MNEREKSLLAEVETRLFIGGEWADSSSGKTFEVRDPATNEVIARVADASAEEGVRALDANMPLMRVLGNKTMSFIVGLIFRHYFTDIPNFFFAIFK